MPESAALATAHLVEINRASGVGFTSAEGSFAGVAKTGWMIVYGKASSREAVK